MVAQGGLASFAIESRSARVITGIIILMDSLVGYHIVTEVGAERFANAQ